MPPEAGMSLEAFFTLLFVVFFVPGACFMIMGTQFVRGLLKGYRIKRQREQRRAEMYRRFGL